MDFDRYIKECGALGIKIAGFYQGTPQYRPLLTGQLLEIAQQAMNLHIGDETAFLSTDLGQHAADLENALSPEEWSAYLKVQTDLIREKRRLAYINEADGMFFDAEADSTSKVDWINKRQEIKARYPWPGEYR